jgi:predicted Zn-dependent protease
MNTGYYTYNDVTHQVEITLLKDKLAIVLKDEYGQPRTIYWYYDVISLQGHDTFAHPGPPPQTLRPLSSEIYQQVQQKAQRKKRSIGSRKGLTLLKVLIVLLALALAFYFWAVPWIAGKMANRFPINYEKRMGEQMYQVLKGGFPVDEQRTAYVNEFFKKMNISSRYDIQITVVKSDQANAFAIPGGHIVVYDKVLNGMASYEELAALLSHEFTHIENRHSLRNIFRQVSSKIFLSLLFGNSDAVGSVVIDNADKLKGLSYSRGLESEADENGAELLAARKIDCQGFVKLFELLKKETAGVSTPELVNSHPDLDNRIAGIRELEVCRKNQPTRDTSLHTLFLKIQTAEEPKRGW